MRLAWMPSPLGPLLAGATEAGICRLAFAGRRRPPASTGRNRHLDRLESELAAYFSGKLKVFSVPLVVHGTPFQERVWKGLLRIPYGETSSYQALAASAGSPKAQRAVGRANHVNRIAILIPCHRVVRKGGAIGGYGGGLGRKRFLLDLERSRRG